MDHDSVETNESNKLNKNNKKDKNNNKWTLHIIAATIILIWFIPNKQKLISIIFNVLKMLAKISTQKWCWIALTSLEE